jgi:hypothetical protein
MRSSLARQLTNTCVSLALCVVAAANGFSIGFDNTFATGGKYLASFPPTGDPTSSGGQLFLLPSGKIIVVGSYGQQGTSSRTNGLLMVGLTSSGVPDADFGTGGSMVIWSPAFNRFLKNSLILPDNSFVVLHQFWESSASNRPVLSKFNSSGKQDVNFAPDLELFPGTTYPVRVAPGAGGKFDLMPMADAM